MAENEELSSKLGFDASAAVRELRRLAKEFDNYSKALRTNAGATESLSREQRTIDADLRRTAGTLDLLSKNFLGLARAQRAAASSTNTVSNQVRNLQKQTGSQQARAQLLQNLTATFRGGPQVAPTTQQTQQATANARTLIASFKEIQLSWSSVLRIFAAQVALGGVRSIISAFREGARAAIDFEIRLAEIQTLSREFQAAGLGEVGRVVTNLAAEFGRPIDDVAEGLYDTLSNQIGNAAQSTRFLTEALRLSTATVSTTEEAVDVLTGIINAYGLSADSAATISDKLFRTVDLGNVRLQDMAGTLGRVTPLAASLGVSLDEVLASVAELTIQGVKADDAFTQITNVMLKLIRPTEALKRRFDELGISSAEAGIAAFGFQGLLEQITAESGTAASEIGEFFNQIRGTRGAIGLVSTNAERYKRTLEDIKNATGAAQEAANLILETPAAQLRRQLTELQGFLVNDFGRSAIKVFTDLNAAVGGVENTFKVAAAAVLSLVGAFGSLVVINQINGLLGVFNTSLTGVLATSRALQAVLAGGALFAGGGIITAGIITALDVFDTFESEIESVRQAADRLGVSLQRSVKWQLEALEPTIKKQTEELESLGKEIQQGLLGFGASANRDRDLAVRLQEDITNSLRDQLRERTSLLDTFLNKVRSAQVDAADNIRRISDDSTGLRNQAGSRQFERSLQGLSESEQAVRLLARSQQLVEAARQAASKGNVDIARDLFSEADDVANRVADIPQFRARGEAQVNSVLNARIGLNDKLISQEKAQAAEAARIEQAQRKLANTIKTETENNIRLQEQLRDLLQNPTGDQKLTQGRERELRAALSESGRRLDQLFSRVSVGNLGSVSQFARSGAEFAEIQRQLRQSFVSPTSGQALPLQFAIDESAAQVFDTLQATARRIPIRLRVQLETVTGQPFDLNTGIADAQKELAATQKRAAAAIQNQRTSITARGDVETAIARLRGSQDVITKSLERVSLERRSPLAAIGLLSDDSQTLADAKTEGRQLGETLGAQINAGIGAIAAGDNTTVKAILTSLRQQLDSVAKSNENAGFFASEGSKALEQGLREAVTQLEALATAQATLAQQVGFQPLLNGLTSVRDAIVTGKDVQAQASAANIQAINTEASAVEMLGRKLDETNRKRGGIDVSRARGGRIPHFAQGGFVPRSDSVIGAFNPDEFIVTPAASRKFATDLIAMNTGLSPRSSGGSGDTNIENMTIQVSGASSPEATGREVYDRFKRELRKKTVRRF